MTPENKQKLIQELILDEGRVNKIYLDSEGFKTFGIGHLVIKTDPEYNWPVGSKVTQIRIQECFNKDLAIAIAAAKKLVVTFDQLPDNIQRVLVNMAFNLGQTRLSKFVLFLRAVRDRNWTKAEFEMRNSKWARQVPNRVRRLIALVREVKT